MSQDKDVILEITRRLMNIEQKKHELKEVQTAFRADLDAYARRLINHLENDVDEQIAIWYVSDLYWSSESMAGMIKRVCQSVKSKRLYVEDTDFPRNCQYCGEEVLIIVSNWNQMRSAGKQTCDDCRASISARSKIECEKYREKERRLLELKAMPYREYLQTPEWRSFRERVKRHHHYKCQLCNSGESLNVHHRTYERLGAEAYQDVIVLCQPCHHEFHEKRKLHK